MSGNHAYERNSNKHEDESTALQIVNLANADMGYMVEFSGAAVSWFLDKPSIALVALAGKGLLQLYLGYLNRLPHHYRIHHTAIRNTLLGSGLLMALPITTEGTPLQWLIAALLGSLIAWMILITTGCLHNSDSIEEPYTMREVTASLGSVPKAIQRM